MVAMGRAMAENLAAASSNEPACPRTSMISSRGNSLPALIDPWGERTNSKPLEVEARNIQDQLPEPSSGRNLAADRARRTTTYSARFVVAFNTDRLFTKSP